MNNQFDYRLYQARRAEELRKAEQERLARQARPEANPALTQLGRTLEALGQRLQQRAEPGPTARRAYR
jgi:DNA-binding phage protein